MEDFVPFELAVKLNEKGFRKKCLAYYDVEDNVGLLYNTQYTNEAIPCQYTDLLQCHNTGEAESQIDDSDFCIDAPTISQVLKWLREKKDIYISVFIDDDSDNPVTYEIYKNTECVYSHQGEYFTLGDWSKCELKAIEYVLDNLIIGKLYDNLVRNYGNISEEEREEIESLNEIGPDVIEYANWIEEYKNKLEIKYFELFKKARQEDKQELISKACRWLEDNAKIYSDDIAINCLLANFKVAMEDLK